MLIPAPATIYIEESETEDHKISDYINLASFAGQDKFLTASTYSQGAPHQP